MLWHCRFIKLSLKLLTIEHIEYLQRHPIMIIFQSFHIIQVAIYHRINDIFFKNINFFIVSKSGFFVI